MLTMNTAEATLRLADVAQRTNLSKATIYRLMAEQKFPRQVRISHKVSVWREADVNQWVCDMFERVA